MHRRDLRILFIVPPGPCKERRTRAFGPFKATAFLSNAGLLLGTLLNRTGYTVKVADLDYDSATSMETFHLADTVRKLVADFWPDILCVTFLTHQYGAAHIILRTTKQVNSDCITIAGGIHATFEFEDLLCNCECLDFVVCHSGEVPLLAICDQVLNGKKPQAPGLAFCRGRTVEHIRAQPPPRNVYELVGPLDYSMFAPSRLRESCITVLSRFGCRFHCRFCPESAMWPYNPVERPSSYLRNELEFLASLGIRRVGLEDSALSGHWEHFTQDALPMGTMEFYALARADMVTNQFARSIRKTRIRTVVLGGESASDQILRLVRKGIRAEQVQLACETLSAHNIKAGVFWMLGLPGETEGTAMQTIKYAETLKKTGLVSYQDIALFMPYPGTDIAIRPNTYGMKFLHRMWDLYTPSGFEKHPAYQLETLAPEKLYELYQHAQSCSVTAADS